MLRLGRVDRVRIQVSYREAPESPAHDAFLLDLPVADADDPRAEPFDPQLYLDALEPVLYLGSDVPRHYSLHQHRWHTSWAPASGAVDLGLTVTTGEATRATNGATYDAVLGAFRGLLELAGAPQKGRLSRDGALLKARRGAASAYGLDSDDLSLVSSEFQAESATWRCGFRDRVFQRYAVTVGFVDGHPASVRAQREGRDEVRDSVGPE